MFVHLQVIWNDEQSHSNYLTKFYEDFYSAIQSQIDFHLKSRENLPVEPVHNEILEHAMQCNQLIRRYFPREEILEKVKENLCQTSVCLLFGESGCGKSSIMAKLVSEVKIFRSGISNRESLKFIMKSQ